MKVLFILVLPFLCQAQQLIGYSDPVSLSFGITNTKSQNRTTNKLTGISESVVLAFGSQTKLLKSAVSLPVNLKIEKPTQEPARMLESPAVTENTQGFVSINENQITETPKYFALLIGVDKYQYASSSFGNLNKPILDATALYEVLLNNYSFAKENVIFLKNPSRNDIINQFEKLAGIITPQDNLLIFFAGHGYWDERLKVGYWLPSDSRANEKSAWISNSTIRDYIAGINSKHTLLISDACFSGSIFKTRDVNSSINEWGVAKIYKLPSRKAMTSGTLTTVPDESKFMYYLIKRLKENQSKYLTSRQLFSSLETAVLNNTSTVPQFGVIQDTGDEGGDFVFIRK